MQQVTPDKIDAAYARYNKGAKWTREDLARGIREEFEHGTRTPETNVTNDDVEVTTKIAVAHLREREDFYDGLAVLESAPHGYWRGRAKNYIQRRQIALIVVAVMLIIALYETVAHFIAGATIEPIFWASVAAVMGWLLTQVI